MYWQGVSRSPVEDSYITNLLDISGGVHKINVT